MRRQHRDRHRREEGRPRSQRQQNQRERTVADRAPHVGVHGLCLLVTLLDVVVVDLIHVENERREEEEQRVVDRPEPSLIHTDPHRRRDCRTKVYKRAQKQDDVYHVLRRVDARRLV